MMWLARLVLASAFAVGGAAAPVWAASEAGAAPSSLEELLLQVREGDREARAENDRREAQFRAQREQQRALLADALAAKAAEEALSESLEQRFEENEARIPEMQETLRNRMGTLGELFGVVRQVAGDTSGLIGSSLISAQLPGRDEVLAKMAQGRATPSVENLETLWFALQQEMTESGKNVRFPATVTTLGGDKVQREVIRIGPFSVFSDGRYLQYTPESGTLTELGRQPASRFLSTIAAYEEAKDGIAAAAIDPSRGSLLSLLIQTPSFSERVGQGGIIGYITIALGLLGLVLAGERLVYLGVVGRKVAAQVNSAIADPGNPLGRVLAIYEENRSTDVETLELKLDEGILKEIPGLERGNTLIKVVSVAAPLLGLLGTVTGMIQTFEVITLFGGGDPKLMANGISMALVTTVIGLCVAIPLVLLHSIVSGRSAALIQVLEEQSAGLIAARAERGERKIGVDERSREVEGYEEQVGAVHAAAAAS